MVSQYEEYYSGYSRLAYIKWSDFEGTPFEEEARKFSRESAVRTGWTYEEFAGDPGLMKRFIAGDWDNERFLVVPPGKKVKASYDERVIDIE
jgi:hypothetical protein